MPQEMGCLSENGKEFCVETTAGCPVTCRDEAPARGLDNWMTYTAAMQPLA